MRKNKKENNLRIKGWGDIQAIVISILVVCVTIAMAFDFINWKMAMGAIKKSLPTNAQVILKEGRAPRWRPFFWAGSLHGRIDLFSDRDLNIQERTMRWTDGKLYKMDGMLNGSIKSISGVDIPLKLINKNNLMPTSYGETLLKNASGTHTFKIWVYLINKGEPVYKRVYVGQKAVDYPITRQIVEKYRSQIDPENSMTQKDIKWLCSFTHDSLHQYILSFFEAGKVPELFVGKNIYAYNLDGEINNIQKFVKIYKTELTNKRKGSVIGIIYKVDGKTYIKVVYDSWWLGCKGGGYIWDFWKK